MPQNDNIYSEQISRRTFLVCTIGGLLLCGGCPSPQPRGIDYSIFLDRSTSINGESKERYLETDLARVLQSLGPNDRIALYGVHGLTASAQPIFEAELPVNAAEGMSEQMRYQMARKKLVADVQVRARDFLYGPIAAQTDLFGAFSRLPKPANRSRVLIFMSDMRHSTPELDMERVPLGPKNVDATLKSAAIRHRWTADLLRNVEVRCHLDSPVETGPTDARKRAESATRAKKRPVNDREALKAYWSTLIVSLGGTLTHFDNAEFRANEAETTSESQAGETQAPEGFSSALELVQRLL